MKLFYISDLHLATPNEARYQQFISFLHFAPQAGDVLVLGGDIFDLFVGNKRIFKQKFSLVLRALEELQNKGCNIFYLEGNHDFHLEGILNVTSSTLGTFQVMQNDFQITFGNMKIWISHGDLIDPSDHGYRMLRAVTRSTPLRWALQVLPGDFIDGLGNWSSQQSRKYNNLERIPAEEATRIRSLYLNFAKNKVEQGNDFVLVGHSHLADQIPIRATEHEGHYINLGFSPDSIPYFVLEKDGNFSLKQHR